MTRLLGRYIATSTYGAVLIGMVAVGLVVGLERVAPALIGFALSGLLINSFKADRYYNEILDLRYGPEPKR